MTTTSIRTSLAVLDGLPFVDDAFSSTRLLAIAAAVRHVDAERRGLAEGIGADAGQIDVWLAPSRAFMLNAGSTPMPALPLASTRKQLITDVLAGLAADLPPWASLLRLPVRYALLHPAGGAISASSRDWPQHVLLAEEAFATSRELREQLIHELAHQWLYLIEDIWPLERPAAATVTLPSGTRDRTPAEVLGAAHVAAALLRLYRPAATPWAASRARDLAAYGTGCLELAGTLSSDLTEAGHRIAQRLKEAL